MSTKPEHVISKKPAYKLWLYKNPQYGEGPDGWEVYDYKPAFNDLHGELLEVIVVATHRNILKPQP